MNTPDLSPIMIIRLSALGDVAMTLPWVYDLASQKPKQKIVFISKPFISKLLINAPSNLSFLAFDPHKQGGFFGVMAFAHTLHKCYPTATFVDLHDVLRTKLMRYYLKICGHKVTAIEKPRRERKRLLRTRKEKSVPRQLYVPSMHYLYKLTLEKLLPEEVKLRGQYMIEPANKDMRKGARVVTDSHPTIGVAPYAGHAQKEYPVDRMKELINAILRITPEIEIILYTAPGRERQRAQEFIKIDPKRIKFSSAKDLTEELGEMTTLNCMISMDSANQHLASLVGTPVITLWGATHPAAGFKAFNQCAENQLGFDSPERPHSIYGEKELTPDKIDELFSIPLQTIVKRVRHYVGKVK